MFQISTVNALVRDILIAKILICTVNLQIIFRKLYAVIRNDNAWKIPIVLVIRNSSRVFLEKIAIIVIVISTDNDKRLNRGQALFLVSHIFSYLITANALLLFIMVQRWLVGELESQWWWLGDTGFNNSYLDARAVLLNQLDKTCDLFSSLEMQVIIKSMRKKRCTC